MPVRVSYFLVIMIWSTTPLGIKWSTDGVGFLFGVTGRMWLGLLLAGFLMLILRRRPPWHARARLSYLVGGLGTFCAMFMAYWAAQFIPSGWISVIFGLAPIFTGVLSALFLRDRSLGAGRFACLGLSTLGLAVMFHDGAGAGDHVLPGIGAVLLGVLGYSASMVALKAIDAAVGPFSAMTGTLLVTSLLFALASFVTGAPMPEHIPPRTLAAILYLGIIGSVLGFMLFFHVLQNMKATQAALITVITPGCALVLGNVLNQEPLDGYILVGAGLVLAGLVLFEFGQFLFRATTRESDRST